MVRPLTEVKIHYPELGEFKANIFGHPEAISFPHHYPNINESLNIMHGEESGFIATLRFIRFLIEMNLLTKNMAARILTWMEESTTPKQKTEKLQLPPVFGYAEGNRNGQKISVDGPKGSLSKILPSLVCCTMDENTKLHNQPF